MHMLLKFIQSLPSEFSAVVPVSEWRDAETQSRSGSALLSFLQKNKQADQHRDNIKFSAVTEQRLPKMCSHRFVTVGAALLETHPT